MGQRSSNQRQGTRVNVGFGVAVTGGLMIKEVLERVDSTIKENKRQGSMQHRDPRTTEDNRGQPSHLVVQLVVQLKSTTQ